MRTSAAIRIGLWGLWLVLATALALGYAGALHPIGDSLAVFRAQILFAMTLVSLGLRAAGDRGKALFGLGVVFLTTPALAMAYLERPEAGGLRIYQKNMLITNPDLAPLEADIRAMGPDVVTLQEVSKENRVLLAAIQDVLPSQHYCRFAGVGGVAVATRLSMVDGSGFCAKGLAGLQVQGPEGPLWLLSIHLHWPWPYQQSSHLAEILPVIAALEGPIVVAGDFNMVRWSQALAEVRAAARVKAAGPVLGTLPRYAPIATLPIDQVMAPGGGVVVLRGLLGSDHYGLFGLVRVTPDD